MRSRIPSGRLGEVSKSVDSVAAALEVETEPHEFGGILEQAATSILSGTVPIAGSCPLLLDSFDEWIASSGAWDDIAEGFQAVGGEMERVADEMDRQGKIIRETKRATPKDYRQYVKKSSKEVASQLRELEDEIVSCCRAATLHPDRQGDTRRCLRNLQGSMNRTTHSLHELRTLLPGLTADSGTVGPSRHAVDQPRADSPVSNLLGYNPPVSFPTAIPPLVFIEEPEGMTPHFFDWLKQLSSRHSTLLFSRTSPEKLRAELPWSSSLQGVVWITKIEGPGRLPPGSLEEISEVIEKHFKEPARAVAIEGLDLLSTVNGFDRLLKFLHVIKDLGEAHDGHTVVHLKPERFTRQELHRLEGAGPREIPSVRLGRH